MIIDKLDTFPIVLAWVGAIISTLLLIGRIIAWWSYSNNTVAQLISQLDGTSVKFPIWKPLIIAIICWAYVIA